MTSTSGRTGSHWRRRVTGLGSGVAAVAAAVALLTSGTTTITPSVQAPVGPAAPRADEAVVAGPAPLAIGATESFGDYVDLATVGDTVVVQGAFSQVGQTFSSSVVLGDAADGVLAQRGVPGSDGQVSIAVADGAGGWYVGGDFTRIGGVSRSSLAHVDAAGRVERTFDAAIGAGPRSLRLVTSLVVVDDVLYAGGYFDRVAGERRRFVVALSAATGRLLPFRAGVRTRVTDLAYLPAGPDHPARLVVSSDRLSAVDPVTGRPAAGFDLGVSGGVRALAVGSDRLYVGGDGVTALDAATGRVDAAFDAVDPGYRGSVEILEVDGDRLLAGGDFNRLGGLSGPLVALDPVSGRAETGFAPDLGDTVNDVTRLGGRLVVATGNTSGPRVDRPVAVLDATTGGDLPVRPGGWGPRRSRDVNTVEVSGDRVWVGGLFTVTGERLARGLMGVDAETLRPRWGYRGPRIAPDTRLLAGDDVVYVVPANGSGWLRRTDPPRFRRTVDDVVAVDAATGAERPRLGRTGVRGFSGATAFGGRLYLARRLDDVGRYPRTRVDVISQRTGRQVDTFTVPLRGYVTDLDHLDGDLLVAGSFTSPQGDTALLRLDGRTHERDPDFDPHLNGPVTDLATAGRAVYVSGDFTRFTRERGPVAGARRGLARLRPNGSVDTTWTAAGVVGGRATGLTAVPGYLLVLPGGLRIPTPRADRPVVLDAATGEQTSLPLPRARQLATAAATPAGLVAAVVLRLPRGFDPRAQISTLVRGAGRP